MNITITLPSHLHSRADEATQTIQALANHLTLDRGTHRGRPKSNAARDAEIYRQYKAGLTYAALAGAFGISTIRVAQILAEGRAAEGATMTQGEGSV